MDVFVLDCKTWFDFFVSVQTRMWKKWSQITCSNIKHITHKSRGSVKNKMLPLVCMSAFIFSFVFFFLANKLPSNKIWSSATDGSQEVVSYVFQVSRDVGSMLLCLNRNFTLRVYGHSLWWLLKWYLGNYIVYPSSEGMGIRQSPFFIRSCSTVHQHVYNSCA